MRSKVLKFLSLLVICVISLFVNQSNEAKAADYQPGGFKTAKGIQIKSIQGNASLTTACQNVWNNISSKVSLTSGSSDRIIKTYFDCTPAPTRGDYGRTYYYYKGSKLNENLLTLTGTWDIAQCIQYIEKDLDTTNKKKYTAVHEVGHALSLKHPPRNDIEAVMKQQLKSYTALWAYCGTANYNRYKRQIIFPLSTDLSVPFDSLRQDISKVAAHTCSFITEK